MEGKIEYKVHNTENIYFAIKVLISLGFYAGFFLFVYFVYERDIAQEMRPMELLLFNILAICFFFFLRNGLFIGYLKGNGVLLSKDQFPDIYRIVEKQSNSLGLSKIPEVYIMQSGGFINAFAAKFLATNYVILYSETIETAIEQDIHSLEFIIGHELGHIARNHPLKRVLTLPSAVIPFLEFAYYRACEYTCDNIGYSLSPKGLKSGLLILAAGRNLFKKVNFEQFINQKTTNDGFWLWFSEKMSTHPHLTNRLNVYYDEIKALEQNEVSKSRVEKLETDHSKYMPL